jgi:hypothetical protein
MMTKFIVLLICSLTTNLGFSQKKYCDLSDPFSSRCLIIDSSNSFIYDYSSCTGMVYGKGKISKTKNKYLFQFDSLQCPEVIKKGKQDSIGVVLIGIKHIISIEPLCCNQIKYNNQFYSLDSTGHIEVNYNGGIIIVYQERKMLFPL